MFYLSRIVSRKFDSIRILSLGLECLAWRACVDCARACVRGEMMMAICLDLFAYSPYPQSRSPHLHTLTPSAVARRIEHASTLSSNSKGSLAKPLLTVASCSLFSTMRPPGRHVDGCLPV